MVAQTPQSFPFEVEGMPYPGCPEEQLVPSAAALSLFYANADKFEKALGVKAGQEQEVVLLGARSGGWAALLAATGAAPHPCVTWSLSCGVCGLGSCNAGAGQRCWRPDVCFLCPLRALRASGPWPSLGWCMLQSLGPSRGGLGVQEGKWGPAAGSNEGVSGMAA